MDASLKKFKYFLAFFIGTFSHSAFATENFTFIEYSSAFVLGLSLPLIIITFLMKDKVQNSWWYNICLGSSLLFLLFTLSRNELLNNTFYFSAAGLFVFLLTVFPRTGSYKQDSCVAGINLINSILLINVLGYLACLWYFVSLNTYYLWAGYSIIAIIVSFIRIALIHKHQASDNIRFNFLWLSTALFCASIFLQAYNSASNNFIIIGATLCYVLAFINYSWLLTSKIRRYLQRDIAMHYDSQIDELKNLSLDSVTNLPMQAHAIKYVEQYIKFRSEYEFAVIVFKPLNFEKVNQALGHQTSDILLLQFAYSLQQALSENSELINFNPNGEPIRIARLPSLQFLIVLDITHKEGRLADHAEALSRELALAIPKAMSFKSFYLNFELTYGVDYYNKNSENLYSTIGKASDALLTAQASQQKIAYYNHQQNTYGEKTLLKMEQLKQAVSAKKIQWLMQPQIHCHTKNIYGYELVPAWQVTHKEETKTLLFDEFVNTAEMSGQIYALTLQSIEYACRYIIENQSKGITQPITIQFASEYILDITFVEHIEKQLEQYGIAANNLIVALPESLLLKAPDKAKHVIDSLKKSDINVAITGFSGSQESLRYLRKLKVTKVYLDCGVLAEHEDKLSEKSILNALVNLAQVMHIPLIAKNINSAAIETIYHDIGGIYGQGNIICPYLSSNELHAWYKQWQSQYEHF